MSKTLDQLRAEFIALYCQDVRESPECYGTSARLNPGVMACSIIDGLDQRDLAQFLREFKAERRLVAKMA